MRALTATLCLTLPHTSPSPSPAQVLNASMEFLRGRLGASVYVAMTDLPDKTIPLEEPVDPEALAAAEAEAAAAAEALGEAAEGEEAPPAEEAVFARIGS